MKSKECYHFWMPTKGKADFMFVQHISTLKSTGRMAVIMPHGVLFRGGEERKMREWMIRCGYLEAVIGLPPALFYGTGIPASILIINRAGAATRKEVLFINADLIPDEEILQSQFPDVPKEMNDNEARRDELDALFKEVNELEEGAWSEEDYEVYPKAELAEVKAQIKSLGGELKEIERAIKNKRQQVKALKHTGESFQSIENEITALTPQAEALSDRIAEQEKRIARHAEREAELKACKKIIKEIKEHKEKLVEEARNKIDNAEARQLILARWERTLYATVEEYLAQ